MKSILFLVLMLCCFSSFAGSISSKLAGVGFSNHNKYAFIKLKNPILDLDACANKRNALVVDISNKRGELIYVTALAAIIAGEELLIVYNPGCPSGVNFSLLDRLHLS
jgi:hypothetical protein